MNGVTLLCSKEILPIFFALLLDYCLALFMFFLPCLGYCLDFIKL